MLKLKAFAIQCNRCQQQLRIKNSSLCVGGKGICCEYTVEVKTCLLVNNNCLKRNGSYDEDLVYSFIELNIELIR